ncbi:MAG: hypothetical protein E7670_06200 [Ruminococcaceae bacterium]|nr:hypothetical protein [Oscillospiraceae bacterium]
MNNSDKRKLDVISNIDDEIVDRVTVKRFTLISKILEKKPNKKRIVAWIAVAASFFLVFGGVLAVVLGNLKQVPIYTGMTVSSTLDGKTVVAQLPEFENDFERLAHEAVFLDHSEKDEKDKDDKKDKNNKNEAEETTDPLNVQGSNALYYAKPNSDVYITVHIDNPDDFEILSFTLNGNKYSSYMFEEGSDMENLILKVNIGDVEGIVSYTIDAIKYVDGTDIKDVRMEGDRVVRVGVESEKLPTAAVSAEAVSFSEVSFDVKITDELSLIELVDGKVYAKLYCEDNLVDSKEISLEGGEVKFDGLEVNTDYKYVISARYDALTGEGITEYVLSEKTFKTKAPVLFAEPSVSKTGAQISFVREMGCEDIKIDSIELWHNGAKIKDIASDATSIDGLLSNNEYTLKAYYTFENDRKEITTSFKTDAKAVPIVEITSPTKTQESVGFGISITDTDAVGSIKKIELLHGNDAPVELDIKLSHTIENLLSNNTYTVRVTYEYDLNDGVGKHEIVKTLDIKTDAKAVPTFTVKNDNITTNSIDAEYDITDVDSILSSHKVELYKGHVLILENLEKKLSFTSLNYYTDYTLKITYTFDLNDGNGMQTKVFEKKYKTAPYIKITDCNIANTSAVLEGDTLFMQINIDNPLGMKVESAVINGQTYTVTGATTTERIFIEIIYNGQFAGGDTYLKIDSLNLTLDNVAYTIEPDSEISDNVFINGKLEVVKAEYVDENFEPINWAFPLEKVYMLITLNNPTGYEIDSVNGNITDWIKIDNNRIYKEISASTGVNTFTLTSIKYHNSYIQKELSVSSVIARCYKVISDEIKYISTPDDLKNMNGGYYYELQNDIDLSGLEWIGAAFNGVFDGKVYSIKNMSFVGTIKNADAYLGLFSNGTGVIENVDLESVNIIATVTSDISSRYVYCGGLVAEVWSTLFINNCTVDENSIISVNIGSTSADVYSYAGGFVGSLGGYSFSLTITNSYNSGDISVSGNNDSSAGGLVGYGASGGSSSLTITNSYNSGDISASNHVGGLVGELFGSEGCLYITNSYNSGNISSSNSAGGLVGYCYGGSSSLTITNSYNSGNISSSNSAGGLVGYNSSSLTITNSYNSGDISVSGNNGSSAGGLVGYGASGGSSSLTITNSYNSGDISASNHVGGLVGCNYGPTLYITNSYNSGNISSSYRAGGLVGFSIDTVSCAITNSYSLVKGNKGENGKPCSVAQLDSKEFYTETLGWSEEVWDLSSLDFNNKKYPKLKF